MGVKREMCRWLCRMLWFGSAILSIVSVWTLLSQADVIYVWSKDGTIQKFSTNQTATLFASNLAAWNGPVGLACDNVGNLYAGVPSSSSVIRFSPDGSVSAGGNVDSVSGLAFDNTGVLYASIPNFREVVKLTLVGGQFYYVHCATTDFSYPTSLAFDRAGFGFVANNTNAIPFNSTWPGNYDNMIQRFSAGCTGLSIFATNPACPSGIAFDAQGNLFVSNPSTNGGFRNTIFRYSTNGFRNTFATPSSGLNGPQGLAFDSAGNLYVANSGDGTILEFSVNGSRSVFASGLDRPFTIAIYPGLAQWSATKIQLIADGILTNGDFQLSFRGTAGLPFTVLATTNPAAIDNWAPIGTATEIDSGVYVFREPADANTGGKFYRVRSQ